MRKIKHALGIPTGPKPPKDVEHTPDSLEKRDTNLDGASMSRASTSNEGASGIRTLQRYRGGPNLERILYLEQNSALTDKHLTVSVEQVGIFLCSDNSVISFFEHSANIIESFILKRLNTEDTILRRSADSSMIVQAIIDAIIDLAIPVVAAYEDAMGELELDVLEDPEIHHSQSLYLLTSELSILRNTIQPIISSSTRCATTSRTPCSKTGSSTKTPISPPAKQCPPSPSRPSHTPTSATSRTTAS